MSRGNEFATVRRNHRAVEMVYDAVEPLGARLSFSAAEDFADSPEPAIVVANHPLGPPDAIALGIAWLKATGRPLHFLLKAELEQNPLFRPIIRPLGGIAINNNEATTIEQLRAVLQAVKDGYDIGVFPSGKQTFNNEVPAFGSGELSLASSTGATIQTAGIFGAEPFRIVPQASALSKLGRSVDGMLQPMHVHFGDTINPTEYNRKDPVSKANGAAAIHRGVVKATHEAVQHWRALHEPRGELL